MTATHPELGEHKNPGASPPGEWGKPVAIRGMLSFNPGPEPKMRLSTRFFMLSQQPVATPFRHGGGEFEGVSLGVPFAGVGISPSRHGARIEIIVDSLHHSCIEQQAFDPVTLPEAALISGRTVDVEILSDN
jgi:hypothetical protein